jgi:hypothetical protein
MLALVELLAERPPLPEASGLAGFVGAIELSEEFEPCADVLALALPLLEPFEPPFAPTSVELLTPTDGKLAPTLVPLPTDTCAKAGAADKARASATEQNFDIMTGS